MTQPPDPSEPNNPAPPPDPTAPAYQPPPDPAYQPPPPPPPPPYEPPPAYQPPPPYEPPPAYQPPPAQSPYPPAPGSPYPPAPGSPYPPAPGSGYLPAPQVPPGYGYGQVAPGGAPPGMWYDPASGLTLPNGVELASVGRRIGAYFLSIVLFIVTLGIGFIIWGLIGWTKGRSPAFQVLGCRVWRPGEQRVANFGYMALRDIVGGIVTGILGIITELTSFILFVAGKQHKSLADHIASTVVLYDPHKALPQ